MMSEELNNMFNEVLNVEKTMLERYQNIIKEFKNKKIIASLQEIITDEIEHVNNAEKIIAIIKES
jgi:bacterioferritin (cytochrome b1)